MQVSEADDGREISIAVGETLELALPEASGTGFRWTLTSVDKSILALEKEHFADTAVTAPGSGRMRRWLFKAIAPGTATVALVYARPWEKKAPVRSFNMKLRTF